MPASAQLGGSTEPPGRTRTSAQPYYEARRVAYDNGYREGLKEGERDGRGRDGFSYQDERTWQRADKGYNRASATSSRYQQSFRAGFSEGYSDGYSPLRADSRLGMAYPVARRARVPARSIRKAGYPVETAIRIPYYGNQGAYGQGGYGYSAAYPPTALNDGYEKGREDARKHRLYDPLRHDWYRDGDRTTRASTGRTSSTRTSTARAFQEGYERGYRELETIGDADCRDVSRHPSDAELERRNRGRRWRGPTALSVHSEEPLHPSEERRRSLGRSPPSPSRAPWRARAPRDGGDSDLLDRVRIRRAESSEHLGIELEHGRVAARDARRGPRLAGQQRHLAEVAAGFDRRDLARVGLEHDVDAARARRRTSTARARPAGRSLRRRRRRGVVVAAAISRALLVASARANRSTPARSRSRSRTLACRIRLRPVRVDISTWIGHGISMPWRANA